jgi:hypothetical protein
LAVDSESFGLRVSSWLMVDGLSFIEGIKCIFYEL